MNKNYYLHKKIFNKTIFIIKKIKIKIYNNTLYNSLS